MNRRKRRSIRPRHSLPRLKPTRGSQKTRPPIPILVADADGTVVETLGDPGQVVAAGQTVVQLAQAGPREAVVWLPETIRPGIGSEAEASVYGGDGLSGKARLRQISDAADPQTRTYEARYVLEGAAASAPLGSTVTIKILDADRQSEVAVPVGAILDDGNRTGVWVVNGATSTVKFTPSSSNGSARRRHLSPASGLVSRLSLWARIFWKMARPSGLPRRQEVTK